ncbi:quaternary amine ABC transporter ATP-binding protein [Kiritimatiella glycovorans]|uniref:Glycine betaine/carnitine transport ATP-binding protein GbuA n=1 Tax=Kiritimatiella glycovorans TaxID=1307763 RepID=A0A0G3EKV3_9BACT|nr:glycine betaine/L-proline ABC transporter ATP-binding protein [Kiritimatiella glycovorans]AKJ65385.1 Glycine betaine/carnitine transport ATP-binding protein GbuA [Kiritimatiella glycovorans]
MAGEACIECKGLYKIFGHRVPAARKLVDKGVAKEEILKRTGCTVGVNNAEFTINNGEVFVVMGLSGSGKSTLLRCLNRLIEPSMGSVILDGEDVRQVSKERLREIRRVKYSMVFQHFGLLPHRNVTDNVGYGLEIRGVPEADRKDKVMDAIRQVGLEGYESSPVQSLSGGMQQRVGLARALATNPEILLMDEAFSALDPLIRTQMQDELLDMQAEMHKTVVFITHDLDEALKIGDRIAIMKDGVIVQIGTPEQIITLPADEYVRAFVENVDRSKVITARTIMRRPDTLALHKDGPHQAMRHMRQSGLSTVFVTDQDRKLQGYVRIDEAVGASKEGKTDLKEILVKDVNTVKPDTSIADMVADASGSSIPFAVVGDEGRFLGIVTRADLLSGIAGEGGAE